MVYLLLSILSSASIYLLFKIFGLKNVNLLPAIVINYAIASSFGFLHFATASEKAHIQPDWWPIALIISLLFISLFYLMAATTQKLGVSVASNASKMSMIIPIIILAILHQSERLSFIQIIGIGIALIGIYLTSLKPKNNHSERNIIWPLLLFIGTGILDYVLAYANQNLLNTSADDKLFTAMLFFMAFGWGTIVLAIIWIRKGIKLNKATIIGGITLGLFNYGSIFFLLRTYASGFAKKTVILPVNNMGVMVVSILFSILLFHERLTLKNRIGIVISLLAISIIFFA